MLREMCRHKLDFEQLQLGQDLENTLQKQGKSASMSFTNLNYAKGKGYTLRIYINHYDYREYNFKFVSGSTVQEYLNTIEYIDKNKKFKLHRSTIDERYLIDILEQEEIFYHVESDFLYLRDMDYSIDVTEIAELHYIKDELAVYITQEDGEKIKLDLENEEVIFLDEEEDDDAEPLTIDFIKRLVNEFNKLNYWCNLVFKDNSIYILNKETNILKELIDIDNIDIIKLIDKQLAIEFINEDDCGFNCCLIDKNGIQY